MQGQHAEAQLCDLRELRMLLETAEPDNVAIAFPSEIQPRLGENQHLLPRAAPAQCVGPGSAQQHCIWPAQQGKLRRRQMQLSSLKTSQDSEESVLTLAEQKLKSIFSDPQLQRPEVFTPFSPVHASSAAAALPATLGIQNSISFLISPSDECGWNVTCFSPSSRTKTWKVSCYTWEYLSLKVSNTGPWWWRE